jgi:vacuolar-type H+-ATPase subunit I/STV1
MAEVLGSQRDKLLASYEKLSTFSTNFNVRKLAACTKQNINTFYILCGWMSEKDAKAFQKEISNDEKTFCIVEDDLRQSFITRSCLSRLKCLSRCTAFRPIMRSIRPC